MQDLAEKQVLFRFDKIDGYVPARAIGYLEHYKWLSLKVYGIGDVIYGRRKGVWYTKDTILGFLQRKYSPRFEAIMSKVAITPGCWIWQGIITTDGFPHIALTQHMHSFMTAPVQYILFKLVFGHKPEKLGMTCLNPICCRPSHMQEQFYEIGKTM